MNFNPRGPCGPRPRLSQPAFSIRDFNPRGPCGPRLRLDHRHSGGERNFNPRGPCGPRLKSSIIFSLSHKNFNPRGPCGPRPAIKNRRPLSLAISIHAARAGRDIPKTYVGSGITRFQSTRPVRAATVTGNKHAGMAAFQSTRPVRAATPGRQLPPQGGGISIHAARAGRDVRRPAALFRCHRFQSTRPVRAATWSTSRSISRWGISIHAARAGRDRLPVLLWDLVIPISIHAARAGRDAHISARLAVRRGFQSTRPVRAATPAETQLARRRSDFNPRGPCGPRHCDRQ